MATNAVKAAADKSAKAQKPATPKHYWKVELVRPPGVSEGVTAYIALAEGAIQNAVDLLGRGVPKPPPDVTDLLQPAVYKTLSTGEATEAYQKIIDTVEATQTWLLMEDAKVIKTSVRVAAEQNMTLKGIQRIVADLNTHLKAIGTAKLKEPQDTAALLKEIVEAIEAVYKKVMAVAELNEDIANGGDKPTPTPTQPKPPTPGTPTTPAGNGGGGGGPSILDQLMPMLGMLPMMAMPLAQMIPEMMRKEEEARKEREEEQNRKPPAAAATPPPGDPNTPSPAEAAPPVTAAPIAAEGDDAGQNPAASGISATPVSLMRPAARSKRRTAEQAGSAEGTQQQADDDEVDGAAVDAPLTVDV
ncbi:hypothetical protein [Nocardia sp. NBC_01009]|uniref:hypothetical protein n=1 Tax=Nocardia sp. NBC_01009 TaxID=2975996 RepID=UPI00387059F8|nr:hypothetical protein OHA42_32635 [Nocardia sp. NBC_01009]